MYLSVCYINVLSKHGNNKSVESMAVPRSTEPTYLLSHVFCIPVPVKVVQISVTYRTTLKKFTVPEKKKLDCVHRMTVPI